MPSSAKAAEVAHKQDESDPLTKEEISAIQEYRDNKIEKIEFKTAGEFIRWLND